MTFANIDDHFDDSPKYVDYDAAEMGLLACGITYANRHLTNGVIPRGWPRRRFPRQGEKALATLLKDGRWILREDGDLEIVGFLDHNLSRDEVLEKRRAKTEVKQEAGRVGGLRSGEARRSKREAESKQEPSSIEAPACKHAKQNEALSSPLLSDPTPIQSENCEGAVPAQPMAQTSKPRNRKPETDCPPSGEDPTAWLAANGIPALTSNPEVQRFLDHHRSKQNRFRDWAAAWRTWESGRFAPSATRLKVVQQAPEGGLSFWERPKASG